MTHDPKNDPDTPSKFASLFTQRTESAQIETQEKIKPMRIAVRMKRESIQKMRKEKAEEMLERLPERDECFHMISNGDFDYFQMIPIIAKMAGLKNATLHASTWTLNRPNALEMLEMIDNKTFSQIHLLTGTYFKRRESAVYATIANGLLSRGSKIKCLENHAKVALISDGEKFYVMEGSANFTANPRIEQNLITESKILYEHHRKWIDEIFSFEK